MLRQKIDRLVELNEWGFEQNEWNSYSHSYCSSYWTLLQ